MPQRTALFIGLLFLVAGSPVVLLAQNPQEDAENIWEDDARRGRHPRWSWWWSDDSVERILKGIRSRDPEKADELIKLRKKDQEAFRVELGRHGRPEIEQISREWFEARRRQRLEDFVKWLKSNYPDEEKSLSTIKEKDPQLYAKNSEHLLEKYGRIFDAEMSNPELGAVLKEDLSLKNRRDELVRKIRHEKSEAKKQALGVELQDVVARRYDLIVRRKEIAYEQLQKKLEEMQKEIRKSKEDIVRWQDPKLRRENVRRRIETLTEDKKGFSWD